ncbi:putative bifunctional inhibitor/plant lipid transfer protein/seed storage helical [Arabidopsis thaliana]|uniref:Bifunctional inhibitor/lipid-transfer protein/seed storage 2S albumin superfamily protein n=1 Tax=Arabidopsis thaliana TaxID=3702 RepID=B3H5X1_ARATH|nr:Bifunctional inhibitor/lipid-transfer protein/seed storage 2S albumin superfamily protein [Arabidopsis thaliana]AEE84637.1 Bifunctional inhibitor/lipid-transfer protein/seed storage 2S albumin superfamily protein [Arabidopsis thaliana]|eukprot:NP_001119032.1 Bifunctional inhibitor/lipid-transfer protein/seed storage 2S albumin superfamily protein [Arabidopsis thaliana]
MAYTNQISAVVFLAVAIAPLLAEPQSTMFPEMTPECATVMPDLLEKCFATGSVTPTEDCCTDLKSATSTQVTCLCDNYIANPAVSNITGPYSKAITTKCGVFDKYSCDGTSKGEEKKGGSSSSNGKDNGKSEGNGGRANSVAASMAMFGLLASLVFVMF